MQGDEEGVPINCERFINIDQSRYFRVLDDEELIGSVFCCNFFDDNAVGFGQLFAKIFHKTAANEREIFSGHFRSALSLPPFTIGDFRDRIPSGIIVDYSILQPD